MGLKYLNINQVVIYTNTFMRPAKRHRPVIVKRGSDRLKWWMEAQSTMFKLKGISWLVNNKITGNILYLLDGYIFDDFLKQHLIAFVD